MIDIRSNTNTQGGNEICFLVEDAHLTSPFFKVHIPNLMGGIDANRPEYKENINSSRCINKGGRIPKKLACQGFILAENMTSYGHRLDGFVPHFKIQKLTAATGSVDTIDGNINSDTLPSGCGPHTHGISASYTETGNKLNTIEFLDLNAYMSTEVDLQNIHNKVLKKGHMMIGTFASGNQSRFYILGIANVSPRWVGKTTRGDIDVTDTTIDGSKNPTNKQG